MTNNPTEQQEDLRAKLLEALDASSEDSYVDNRAGALIESLEALFTTEQQATPTSEEELRDAIDSLFVQAKEYPRINRRSLTSKAMQLIHQYGNTRELEGRISERENTELPTTDHSECFDKRTCTGYQNAASDLYNENLIRIDELAKAKETPHETS